MRKYLLILFILLPSCGELATGPTPVFTKEPALQEALEGAVDFWNGECPLFHIGEGGLEVVVTNFGGNPRFAAGYFNAKTDPDTVYISTIMLDQTPEYKRSVIEHELGHFLRLKHSDTGLMVAIGPSKEDISDEQHDWVCDGTMFDGVIDLSQEFDELDQFGDNLQ